MKTWITGILVGMVLVVTVPPVAAHERSTYKRRYVDNHRALERQIGQRHGHETWEERKRHLWRDAQRSYYRRRVWLRENKPVFYWEPGHHGTAVGAIRYVWPASQEGTAIRVFTCESGLNIYAANGQHLGIAQQNLAARQRYGFAYNAYVQSKSSYLQWQNGGWDHWDFGCY